MFTFKFALKMVELPDEIWHKIVSYNQNDKIMERLIHLLSCAKQANMKLTLQNLQLHSDINHLEYLLTEYAPDVERRLEFTGTMFSDEDDSDSTYSSDIEVLDLTDI